MIPDALGVSFRIVVLIWFASEIIIPLLGAWRCWQIVSEDGINKVAAVVYTSLGVALVGIAIDAFATFVGAGIDRPLVPPQPRHSSNYMEIVLSGRFAKDATVYALVAVLLMLRRKR